MDELLSHQETLATIDVPRTVKVAWNTQMERLVALP